MARERLFLEEALAAQIINRRLEAHARGHSAFVGGGVGTSRVAQHRQHDLAVALRPRRQLARRADRGLCDHRRCAARAAERATRSQRELQNIRTAVDRRRAGRADRPVAGPRRAAGRRGRQWLGGGDRPDRARQFRGQCAADDAGADRRGDAGHVHRLGPAHAGGVAGRRSPGGETALAEGLAAARAAAPAARTAERPVSFDDLPRLGRPGRVVSRRRIEDMDVTIVTFANGSTLTFKHTDYDRGSVAGPAALRRRRLRRSRPTGRRWAGWPGWSRPPASPVSTSAGWSGC